MADLLAAQGDRGLLMGFVLRYVNIFYATYDRAGVERANDARVEYLYD